MSNKPFKAFEALMTPVIKLLLYSGVTYQEFIALCKTLYVKVAAKNFGLRGRPTNVSRMSVMTGLDRKEIKRIKDDLETDEGIQLLRSDRISRLLTAWHQDSAFSGAQGQANILAIKGENSFETLAKRYGGNVPPSTLLKELLRAGVAIEHPEDKVEATKRIYITAQNDQEAMERAGKVIFDLGNTLCHNLFKEEPKRFERRATNVQIPPHKVNDFRAFIEHEGQHFLEKVDAWLSENEQPSSPNDVVRLGIGLYWIEEHHFEE